MDEGDHVPSSTWTGFAINQANTVLCEVLQQPLQIRHREANLLHARSTLCKKPTDWRILACGFQEFDFGTGAEVSGFVVEKKRVVTPWSSTVSSSLPCTSPINDQKELLSSS